MAKSELLKAGSNIILLTIVPSIPQPLFAIVAITQHSLHLYWLHKTNLDSDKHSNL